MKPQILINKETRGGAYIIQIMIVDFEWKLGPLPLTIRMNWDSIAYVCVDLEPHTQFLRQDMANHETKSDSLIVHMTCALNLSKGSK